MRAFTLIPLSSLKFSLSNFTDKHAIRTRVSSSRQPVIRSGPCFSGRDDFKAIGINANLESNFVRFSLVLEFLSVISLDHFKIRACVDASAIQSSRPRFKSLLENRVSVLDICIMIRHGPLARRLFRAYSIWAKPLVVFVSANNINR